MKKRVTIHDIAREAGVSSATVSRVLGESGYPVSGKLRNKITQLAEQMQYIPNLIGKQLKTNNNLTIGVIIPTINNPFYAAVILGIEEIARKNGYNVLLCNSLQDGKLEDVYLKTMFEKQLKGLIISSIFGYQAQIMRMVELGTQFIAIDQKIEVPGIQQIQFDFQLGGMMAVNHLIERGHRRIAYVSSPLDRPSRRGIYQGYIDSIKSAGLEVIAAYVQIAEQETEIYDGIYEFENGKVLTRSLLKLGVHPTAIFACNDLTAFGVIHEIAAHGLKVPEDISVIGFDNIEFTRMVTPALTTIKQPNYEMGKLACTMLLDKLSGRDNGNIDIILQPELIERDSVGAV